MMRGRLFVGRVLLVISILICLFFVNTDLAGAYQLSARSFGMGGAFTAVADDVEAILYNPAGMADSGKDSREKVADHFAMSFLVPAKVLNSYSYYFDGYVDLDLIVEKKKSLV